MDRTLTTLERRLDELEAELAGDDAPAIRDVRDEQGFRILLEALADVHALSALERAMMESPRVRTLELQAYAGGWASLVVDVS